MGIVMLWLSRALKFRFSLKDVWLKFMKHIFKILISFLFLSSLALGANAHPHVFLEANLELVKNDDGKVMEIRQVWRFDELFSTNVIVDFDANSSGDLDSAEMSEIEKIIKENLKEFDYYTAVKHDNKDFDIGVPEIFHVDYDGDQIVMILAFELEEPIEVKGKQFAVSISDPTYYVAVEIADKKSVTFVNTEKPCEFDIARPDFDALYEKNPQVFSDSFQGSDDPEVFSSDEYFTWVNFSCD